MSAARLLDNAHPGSRDLAELCSADVSVVRA